MINEIYEYSTQPYMVVWSILFVLFAFLALLSIFSGFDLDMDLDADLDIDGDISAEASGGLLEGFFIFLNIGTVPVTLIVFTIVAINWGGGIYLNELFNSNHNIFLGFGIGLALLIVSIPVTKVVTYPIKVLFKMLNEDQEALDKAIGSICDIQSNVSERKGYAIINTTSTPINIMVRCEEGQTIPKGSKAVVLEFDNKKNRYLVAKVEDDIFNDIEKK